MKRKTAVLSLMVLLGLAGHVTAATITLIPPNDPSGAVFTTNSNDAYNNGRGDVFRVDSTTTIDSVGLFQDLTNINLNYSVFQTTTAAGNVSAGETLLRSGSSVQTTAGLQWIDFGFAPLTLLAGSFYHIEFSFNGNSNQNFFYNNNNVPFSLGPFSLVDGTQGGNTVNFVMPAIRVNTVDAAQVVPEPSSILLFGTGAAAMIVAVRRRRKQQVQ